MGVVEVGQLDGSETPLTSPTVIYAAACLISAWHGYETCKALHTSKPDTGDGVGRGWRFGKPRGEARAHGRWGPSSRGLDREAEIRAWKRGNGRLMARMVLHCDECEWGRHVKRALVSGDLEAGPPSPRVSRYRALCLFFTPVLDFLSLCDGQR